MFNKNTTAATLALLASVDEGDFTGLYAIARSSDMWTVEVAVAYAKAYFRVAGHERTLEENRVAMQAAAKARQPYQYAGQIQDIVPVREVKYHFSGNVITPKMMDVLRNAMKK